MMNADTPQPRPQGNKPVLLTGRLLTITRAVWLLIATLSIGLFIAGVPFRYRQLVDTCLGTECPFMQLSQPEVLALQRLGISPAVYATYLVTLAITWALVYSVVAFVIFWRRSDEWMALLVALWLVTFGTTETYLALAASLPPLEPLTLFLDQLGWVALLPLFLFAFPNGRFVPLWTRWILFAFLALGTVSITIEQLFPHVTENDTGPQALWFSVMLTGIGTQVYRYRRFSDPTQRQQTKWVVSGLVVAAVGMAGWAVLLQSLLPVNRPGVPSLLGNLIEITLVTSVFVIVAVTIGYSILRYRLWDIDLIIRRTLQYTLITGVLALLYFGGVVLLQAVFRGRTGQADSSLITVISTLAIAGLFTPVRRRVQEFVDRRFFRRKYDAAQTLAQFARTARDETDLDILTADLLRVVQDTMQPERLLIWMKGPGRPLRNELRNGEETVIW